ncbi:DUF397 domain-containing protein [Streptomyces lonarensis]|uniref:DUF397 domain-containing protein n=1 Tax=Streptomyces lonarensis TaxID=700599 RepID=A0A7X6D0K1_9ACTN|nr:DUF397 domain-containing protein [Streptomyces lonarensis]NJQ05987.1 DUF397 domain-containing protein [Streptomyces lonarensis]
MSAPFSLSSTRWRKSSYSGGDNGSCVEVADGIPTHLPVRDSKNPTGAALTIPNATWTAFIAGLTTSTLGPGARRDTR